MEYRLSFPTLYEETSELLQSHIADFDSLKRSLLYEMLSFQCYLALHSYEIVQLPQAALAKCVALNCLEQF